MRRIDFSLSGQVVGKPDTATGASVPAGAVVALKMASSLASFSDIVVVRSLLPSPEFVMGVEVNQNTDIDALRFFIERDIASFEAKSTNGNVYFVEAFATYEESILDITADDFKAAGFRVSQQCSSTEIRRALADVVDAYIKKMKADFDPTDTGVKSAAMALAFILLCQRAAIVTRAGAKVKVTPQQSETGYYNDQDVRVADMLLRKVNAQVEEPSKVVNDVCGIYMRSYFN